MRPRRIERDIMMNTPGSTSFDVHPPTPSLTKDFHLECDLNSKIPLGTGPGGTSSNWISFIGGSWSAPWASGTIEQGGHDYQTVLPDMSARLSTRYLLKSNDTVPAYVVIRTEGWRTGPTDVLQRLQDPAAADAVDPTSYKFRLFVHMETNDERYAFLNTTMWVGSGVRLGAKVIYDAYRVD